MKNIMILSFAFCLLGTINAQNIMRDSIADKIKQHRQNTYQAAELFINADRPSQEKIDALGPYAFIYDFKQIQAFKNIIISTKESPEIRAMALSRVYADVEKDERLLSQVRLWFANPKTPKALRDETLNLIGNFSFSSLPGILDEYYPMVNDPDEKFREFAVSKLIMYGDARTQQLLIRSLEGSQPALFETAKTIGLLSWAHKKEFYPAVFKILQETNDNTTKLAAIEVLGYYLPAREKLVAISQNTKEEEILRESALKALYAGDKDNITKYVTPILEDASASDQLKGLGIQMSIDVRKSMAFRRGAKARKVIPSTKNKQQRRINLFTKRNQERTPDEYDRLIQSIYEGKGIDRSERLAEVANRYLLLVRPNFKN